MKFSPDRKPILDPKRCDICGDTILPKSTTTAGNWRKKRYCGMSCADHARKARNKARQSRQGACGD